MPLKGSVMREIRLAQASDLPALIEVFWRGVHEGAAPRYTPAQRRAWLPLRPEADVWAARLAGQAVFVAKEDAMCTGFFTLTSEGHLDFAYVLPEVRGTGTADALLALLMNHAQVRGLRRLTTRASDMARPFFLRHGWDIIGPEPQIRAGITVSSTRMARGLTA